MAFSLIWLFDQIILDFAHRLDDALLNWFVANLTGYLAMRFDLLSVLQERFPGMDDSALIAACGSTDNAMFVLWERALADNAPSPTIVESAQ